MAMKILLLLSIIFGCVLIAMKDSWGSHAAFTLGFMANLIVLIVAGIGVMQGRIKQLIIIGIASGSLLLVVLFHDVTIGRQSHSLILGGYYSMLGFLAITGLLTMAGLMERGRYQRLSFTFAGLFTLIYTLLLFQTNAGPWVWIVGLFMLVPFMSVLLLMTTLFFWKSMKR